jgi:hypothetical protein
MQPGNSFTLKMEAVRLSETSVNFNFTALLIILEGSNLHLVSDSIPEGSFLLLLVVYLTTLEVL